MAKKQLADLIKEEVGKSTDGEGNGANPPTESGQSTAPAPRATVQDNDGAKTTAATKRKRSPTKADLEATVAELTAQLEAAQTNETTHQEALTQERQAFEQQITKLNAELAEAKSTILQLVDSNANTKTLQQQVKSLQTELTQAKENVTALKQDLQQVDVLKAELSQAQKRITQLSASKTPTAKLPSSRPAAKPIRAASRPVPLSLQKSASSSKPGVPPQTRPEKFLSRDSKFTRMRKDSINRQQPTTKLSDNEIGWFD